MQGEQDDAARLRYRYRRGHIAREEQFFDACAIGTMLLNDCVQFVVDLLQTDRHCLVWSRSDYPKVDGFKSAICQFAHQPVTETRRTRIYAKR